MKVLLHESQAKKVGVGRLSKASLSQMPPLPHHLFQVLSDVWVRFMWQRCQSWQRPVDPEGRGTDTEAIFIVLGLFSVTHLSYFPRCYSKVRETIASERRCCEIKHPKMDASDSQSWVCHSFSTLSLHRAATQQKSTPTPCHSSNFKSLHCIMVTKQMDCFLLLLSKLGPWLKVALR